mmetsp:Transcript_5453/g.12194  ORF Transcript_5453/g.12194 Transcript_5453/m.12194 type:complete len:97 (-) Transcript_5453:813-1103(-)
MKRIENAPCILLKPGLILIIYVDDIILTGRKMCIQNFQQFLHEEKLKFTTKELESTFLGLELTRTQDGLKLTQKAYCQEVVDHFKIGEIAKLGQLR